MELLEPAEVPADGGAGHDGGDPELGRDRRATSVDVLVARIQAELDAAFDPSDAAAGATGAVEVRWDRRR